MSVEFHLESNRLTVDQWNQVLGAWGRQQKQAPYEDPCFRPDLAGGQLARLWRPGSIRGVLLRHGGDDGVLIRMDALASRVDWILGFTIMSAALKHGGGVLRSSDGDVVTDLSKEHAIEWATRDFCEMTLQLQSEPAIRVPFPKLEIELPKSLVPITDATTLPKVETQLAKLVQRVVEGRLEEPPVEENGRTIVTWSAASTAGLGALLPQADHVVLSGAPPEGELVDWELLIEFYGERCVDLGSHVCLPPGDPRDFERLRTLQRHASVQPESLSTELLSEAEGVGGILEDLDEDDADEIPEELNLTVTESVDLSDDTSTGAETPAQQLFDDAADDEEGEQESSLLDLESSPEPQYASPFADLGRAIDEAAETVSGDDDDDDDDDDEPPKNAEFGAGLDLDDNDAAQPEESADSSKPAWEATFEELEEELGSDSPGNGSVQAPSRVHTATLDGDEITELVTEIVTSIRGGHRAEELLDGLVRRGLPEPTVYQIMLMASQAGGRFGQGAKAVDVLTEFRREGHSHELSVAVLQGVAQAMRGDG